jgi:hypothetical protein
MANNNNNVDFQRALAMSMNNRPNAPQRVNNYNANLRNAMRQSANNNRQRLRKEMNREYEEAMAANALAAKQANAAKQAPGINFNQMLPNMKPKVNNSKTAQAMRIATPENTAALAEMFPQFPYAQIEKILKQSKGNVNATRKNLVRRKAVLKLGGSRRNISK